MTDITTLNYPTEAERENLLLYAWDRNTPGAQFRIKIEDLGGVSGAGGSDSQSWDFNFTDDAEAYIFARDAMTIELEGTTGTGTAALQKSTAAAPNTFASATSPVTLQAGAKLKVSASAVTGTFAVHLWRV